MRLKEKIAGNLQRSQYVASDQMLQHIVQYGSGVAADPALAQQRLLQQVQLRLQFSANRQPCLALLYRLAHLLNLPGHLLYLVVVSRKELRSQYVPDYFGELYPALQELKAAFDPWNQLNPGKIATPKTLPDTRLTRVDEVTLRGELDRTIDERVWRSYDTALQRKWRVLQLRSRRRHVSFLERHTQSGAFT